jgi:hypothetical protein
MKTLKFKKIVIFIVGIIMFSIIGYLGYLFLNTPTNEKEEEITTAIINMAG